MKFNKIWIFFIYSILLIFGLFYSLSFYESKFILNDPNYFEIYFEVLLYKMLITIGVALNVILGILIVQRFVKNELASPGILGISQINFIIYASVFAINKPLFNNMFGSNYWYYALAELSLYIIVSLAISFIIVWFAKTLNSKYIIMFGIIINLVLSAISLFIMSMMRAPNNEFNIIYAKMIGSFRNVVPLFGLKMNSTVFLAIISITFGILGLILYHFSYWKVEKNLSLVGKFGISHKHKHMTRIMLIILLSIASSIVFILAGVISFIGIAILLVCRNFIKSNYKITLHAVFMSNIIIIYATQITWNYIEPNILIDMPMGIYITIFAALIIIFIFTQRSFYEWIKNK